MKEFFAKRYKALGDMAQIFLDEVKMVFTDEGVIIFFLLVPLLYPLLYSWLYNNEHVEDVPAIVLDESKTSASRDFIRRCDAAADLKVVGYANDMEDAKKVMMKQGCRGIIVIPSTFSSDIARGKQTTVSLFVNMSGMMNYKALLMTLTDVSLEMGSEIQIQKLGSITTREDEISTHPIESQAVAMFNPRSGYGSYLLPAVLMLIIQQTLLLGIGMSAGTAREDNRYEDLVPMSRRYGGMYRIIFGKGFCYFLIYALMATYLTIVIPRLFHFVQLATLHDLVPILLPYVLACIFFGMTMSCLIRHRENVILVIIFTSVPILFLSGVSWPGASISGYWKGLSYLFPSTFGINAFVKMNSLGATLNDVRSEYYCLWAQVAVYFLLACLVYWWQIRMAHKHVLHNEKERERRKHASKFNIFYRH